MPRKEVIKAQTRGHANHGWLDTNHSFSFAHYFNPNRMGFGKLRVLNDDHVIGGKGFGTHGHDNMEIVSIPLSGDLEHKDSMGNTTVIREGDVQIMSAGTGVRHSEYNHSKTEPVKFLQIWVEPKERNIEPRYDQKSYPKEERRNQLLTVVSPDASDEGAIWINQDAYFSMGQLDSGKSAEYKLRQQGHGIYVFVLHGEVTIADETLTDRDAISLEGYDSISIEAGKDSEFLVLEVPMN